MVLMPRSFAVIMIVLLQSFQAFGQELKVPQLQAAYITDATQPEGKIVALEVDPLLGTLALNHNQFEISLTVDGENVLQKVTPTCSIISPSGTELYVAARSQDTGESGVFVINTQKESASSEASNFISIANISNSHAALTFSRDGSLLYVGCYQNIEIIDTRQAKKVISYYDLHRQTSNLPDDPNEGLYDRKLDLQNRIKESQRYIAGIVTSSDGKTLYVSLSGGVGSKLRNQVLSIDVNLYTDGDPDIPGLQSDVSNYFKRKQIFEMPDLPISGTQDVPKAIVASPLASSAYYTDRVYLPHGAFKYKSDGEQVSLDGVGWMVAIDGQSGDLLQKFGTTTIVGSNRGSIRTSDSIYSKAPAAMAIRPDGQRALVAFAPTGNFGIMDIPSQMEFLTWNDKLSSDTFGGYIGMTPKIQLDAFSWPQNAADLPLMYPIDIAYAQNGKFAVAVHGGSSGHAICSSEPNNSACQQHGAVSIIKDEDIDTEIAANVTKTTFLFSLFGTTSHYSVYPFCKDAEPSTSSCTEPLVTHLFEYTPVGSQPVKFYTPRSVAIQPFVSFITPRFGDFIASSTPINIQWRDPRVDKVSVTVTRRTDGSKQEKTFPEEGSGDRQLLKDNIQRRQSLTFTLHQILGTSSAKSECAIEAAIKIGQEVLSTEAIIVTLEE